MATISGSNGQDSLNGTADPDLIEGFDGDDSLSGNGGNDTLEGGKGHDTLEGDGGNDSLVGDDGNDQLEGGSGDDTLKAGNDDDTLIGGEGADSLDGGGGNRDRADYSGSAAAVNVSLGSGTGSGGDAEGDTLNNIEDLVGSDFNDTLAGDGGDNILIGGLGDDSIFGDNGDDTLQGGAGADTLDGGGGSRDMVDYSGSSAAVAVDLTNNTASGGDATGDVISNFEAVTGTDFNDTLTGTAGDNTLIGGVGDDLFSGGEGKDSQVGGAGNDTFLGDLGDDTLDGGDGIDLVDYSASTTGVDVDLSTGQGSGGDANNDRYTSIENVIGSDFSDTIIGDGADNVIEGGAGADGMDGGLGDDTLSYEGSASGVYADLDRGIGGGGDANGDTITGFENIVGSDQDDFLVGDANANLLDGGTGDDIFIGGAGADTLTGGAGSDSVIYSGSSSAVSVDLDSGTVSGGDAQGDVISDIENVTGTDFDDTITGNASANDIEGGAGDDSLSGAAGNDTLIGGDNADTIDGGADNDLIYGDRAPHIIFSETVDYSYAQDSTGNPANHFGEQGTGTSNDPLLLVDGDVGTEARYHDGDIIEYSFGQTLEAGTSITLVEGTGGEDGDIQVYVSFGTTDPNGDSLSAGGGGVGYENTVVNGQGVLIYSGPSDSSVELILPIDATHIQFVSEVSHGGWSELVLTEELTTEVAGDDSLSGGDGDDTIIAGAGNDTVDGGADNDTITGGDGADSIAGGDGLDTITGDDGADTIDGGLGADSIDGGQGDDVIAGGGGNDTITGGVEVVGVPAERVAFEWSNIPDPDDGGQIDNLDAITTDSQTIGGTTVNISVTGGAGQYETTTVYTNGIDAGTGSVATNSALGFENFSGVLTMDFSTPVENAEFRINDFEQNSETIQISAYDADNNLIPFNVTASADITGSDTDAVAGNDQFQGPLFSTGDAGPDGSILVQIPGPVARIEVTYTENNGSLTMTDVWFDDPATGIAAQSSGNDSIDGGAGDDVIDGDAGNDTLDGGTGADVITGGTGSDSIVLSDGFGNDTIDGSEDVGDGDVDTLDMSGLSEGVIVTYGNNPESGTVTGSNSGDSAQFSNMERAAYTNQGDTIDGSNSAQAMSISAGSGNDSVTGSAGDDTLEGGDGNDTLDGGTGADQISGGAGDDEIRVAQGDNATGGDGDDLFILQDLGEPGSGTVNIIGGEGGETNGDTLRLTPDVSRDDITFTNTDDFAGGLSGNFTMTDGTVVTFSEIENIVCFTKGTRILTPQGKRPIETLRPGDEIVTRDHGNQVLRWIGKRSVSGLGRFAPIEVRNPDAPSDTRPLLVSPQHRLLLRDPTLAMLFGESEALAAAKYLLHRPYVERMPCAEVTYLHIMFDRHEVVFAEGFPAESFYLCDQGLDALTDSAREEVFALFPELRADLSGYGRTARRCLRRFEANLVSL